MSSIWLKWFCITSEAVGYSIRKCYIRSRARELYSGRMWFVVSSSSPHSLHMLSKAIPVWCKCPVNLQSPVAYLLLGWIVFWTLVLFQCRAVAKSRLNEWIRILRNIVSTSNPVVRHTEAAYAMIGLMDYRIHPLGSFWIYTLDFSYHISTSPFRDFSPICAEKLNLFGILNLCTI